MYCGFRLICNDSRGITIIAVIQFITIVHYNINVSHHAAAALHPVFHSKYLHTMQQILPQKQNGIFQQKTTSSWYYLNRYLKIVSIFLFQSLNNKFNSVKNQVSDLHRDVTTRRCLTSYKQVENIVIDCASLTDEIEQTDQLMRERKELFHKMWEEEQQRITTEQTIFKAQVQCPNYKRSFYKSLILYRTPVCTFYKLHSLIFAIKGKSFFTKLKTVWKIVPWTFY